MNYIEFGNKCFNVPASEQSIDIVIGSKTEADSLEDFIEKAINYLCAEIYMENPQSVFPEIINRSAADKGKELISEFLSGMDQCVELHLEEITSIVYVTEPRWNNYDLAFETKNSYVFFTWLTTA